MISQETISVLQKYYVFDKIFDLISYDRNLSKLHDDLKKLKKNFYENNYRFIFLFYDTQYHVRPDQPGLTLLNLQRIVADLDISNFFCLILTQQHIIEQLQQLCRSETTDDCAIDSFTYYNYKYLEDCTVDYGLDINANSISSKYLSLNRVKRFHRRVLFSLLNDKGLLEQGMVSYNNSEKNPDV
jgi:hypothetical protein